MKFANIQMLFLIWAVPLLLLVFWYGMKRRKAILDRFASLPAQRFIAPETGASRRWLKAGLILGVLAFTAVALAGPQYGFRWEEVEQRGIDIIVALDCSKSMLAEDIRPNRLDRAKREIYDLLAMLEGDRIGLVAFAGTAFLQCPLTLDYEAFHLFLKTLTPDYLPVGGTDLNAAVRSALDGFDQTDAEKAIILITDGENTGEGDPMAAAKMAGEKGVKLFCIGIGSETGVPVPDEGGGLKKDREGNIVVTRLDEDLLKRMAVLTGGTYVRSVAGDMDLDVIYAREIRGKMEAGTVASGRKQVWEDRYQWALALAVLLMALELFIPAARRTATLLLLACALCFGAVDASASPLRDGLEAYNAGDYEKALKLFIDAQLDAPDDPKIAYNIGNAYYRLGQFEEAAQSYANALETDDPELKRKALYNLGNSAFRRQQIEKAIEQYEAALKIDPEDRQTKENIEFAQKVLEQQNMQRQNGEGRGDENSEKEPSDENQPSDDSQKEKSEDSQERAKNEQDNASNANPADPSQGDQGQSGDQADGNQRESPEYGKEMADRSSGPSGEEDEGSAQPMAQPGEEGEESAQRAQAAGHGEEGDDGEKGQAERVLNRLQDQPGRAMIPVYRERRVERDW